MAIWGCGIDVEDHSKTLEDHLHLLALKGFLVEPDLVLHVRDGHGPGPPEHRGQLHVAGSVMMMPMPMPWEPPLDAGLVAEKSEPSSRAQGKKSRTRG